MNIKKISSRAATHFLAFVIGVLFLPALIFTTFWLAPDFMSRFVQVSDGPFEAMIDEKKTPQPDGIELLDSAETEIERFHYLGDAAKEAFGKSNYELARSYATELQDLIPVYGGGDWNSGGAIQDSNIVFGLIAIQENRIGDAKKHLIKSGTSSGSPVMNSFGPNMLLAKALLEQGETEVVIEYFNLCKAFWIMSDGKLDEWVILVEAGKIPNFGANLDY